MPSSLMDQAQFKRALSHAIIWPLLAMAVLVLISIGQVNSLLKATRLIGHTDHIIARVRLAQKQISDMQSGLRGYYLTHDPQSLRQYANANTTYLTTEKMLVSMTLRSPREQKHLVDIHADYVRWFTFLHQAKMLPSPVFIVRNKPNMEAFARDFDALITTEDDLRGIRTQAAERAARRAVGVSLIFALSLSLLLAFINRRHLVSLSGHYERSLSLAKSRTEALRASEEHLTTTLKSIGDGVIVTDAAGIISFLNPVAEVLTGWTQQEAKGRDLREVFSICHEGTRDVVESPVDKVLREGVVVGLANHTILTSKQGKETPIDDTGAPIRDAQGGLHGVVLVFHDVSERKRLEGQLLQAQKMETVGRLSGGIAHDFNNLLTAILGFTEMAEGELPDDHPVQGHLRTIQHAGERASDLTRQLLAFARRQVIEPKVTDLNELILGLDKMLRRLIGENIELVMLPEEGLHFVKVDPGQFTQILINLAVNARDAMPNGGNITIETHNAVLDEEYARAHADVIPGEYVMLGVSDTGSGIDEAVQLHIFEPFFTTKEKGRGTGLGLATCYGIVKQAGGHIWLYSEPGQGTTFRIYLPRITEAPEVPRAPETSSPILSGKETVMLVEDEPAVRALAAAALQNYGYTVLEAANGEEAARMARGHTGEIALLLTDVVMPQMNGKELADSLKTTHPGMKVLYVSGYTENTIVHHGVLDAGIAFLSKPFTPTNLIRKVRDVLDNS